MGGGWGARDDGVFACTCDENWSVTCVYILSLLICRVWGRVALGPSSAAIQMCLLLRLCVRPGRLQVPPASHTRLGKPSDLYGGSAARRRVFPTPSLRRVGRLVTPDQGSDPLPGGRDRDGSRRKLWSARDSPRVSRAPRRGHTGSGRGPEDRYLAPLTRPSAAPFTSPDTPAPVPTAIPSRRPSALPSPPVRSGPTSEGPGAATPGPCAGSQYTGAGGPSRRQTRATRAGPSSPASASTTTTVTSPVRGASLSVRHSTTVHRSPRPPVPTPTGQGIVSIPEDPVVVPGGVGCEECPWGWRRPVLGVPPLWTTSCNARASR